MLLRDNEYDLLNFQHHVLEFIKLTKRLSLDQGWCPYNILHQLFFDGLFVTISVFIMTVKRINVDFLNH